MKRTTQAAALSAALAVLAAGCGSSSHSTASRQAGAAGTAGTTSTAAANPYGGGGGSTTNSSAAALITTKHTKKYGTVLAYGPKHLTVYLFEKDKGNTSTCTGQCAKFWPPVTGKATAQGGAAASALGTITRPGGGMQVTYKGHPLYLFTKDGDSGDAYGEGQKAFGGEWYAVKPSGEADDLS